MMALSPFRFGCFINGSSFQFRSYNCYMDSDSRTDRMAKYNQLIRIEELLGESAIYPRGLRFGK